VASLSRVAGLAALGLLAGASAVAQVRFRTETTLVQIDVVVRGADGRPALDLDRDAFVVLEDGTPREIVAFERSTPPAEPRRAGADRPPAGAASGADAMAGAESPPQSIVALVFHQLPARPRADATRAAEALVRDLPAGDYAGVFLFEHTLTQLTAFTRDREALRQAIRQVAMSPPARPSTHGDLADDPAQGFGGSGAADANAMRARMAVDAPADSFEAGQQGASFGALVRHLAGFAGRRAVVLLSEGLAVPDVLPRLETVIDRAAAAHVSFYTIDARGLRPGAQRQPSSGRLAAAVLTSASRAPSRRTKLAKLDASRGLRPLAELTGGRYLTGTNDLGAALAQVTADRRSYYTIAYRSSSSGGDAATANIEVRVTRPGVEVRARTRLESPDPD
jgi:VWFA-related protein